MRGGAGWGGPVLTAGAELAGAFLTAGMDVSLPCTSFAKWAMPVVRSLSLPRKVLVVVPVPTAEVGILAVPARPSARLASVSELAVLALPAGPFATLASAAELALTIASRNGTAPFSSGLISRRRWQTPSTSLALGELSAPAHKGSDAFSDCSPFCPQGQGECPVLGPSNSLAPEDLSAPAHQGSDTFPLVTSFCPHSAGECPVLGLSSCQRPRESSELDSSLSRARLIPLCRLSCCAPATPTRPLSAAAKRRGWGVVPPPPPEGLPVLLRLAWVTVGLKLGLNSEPLLLRWASPARFPAIPRPAWLPVGEPEWWLAVGLAAGLAVLWCAASTACLKPLLGDTVTVGPDRWAPSPHSWLP